MKENETLKYDEKKQFNSKILQQYDAEGQRYFLGYLLRKGYKLAIKESEIIFTDISLEDKVKEVIERYNNETKIENLNIKRQCIRETREIGLEAYSKMIDNKLRKLNRNEKMER